MSSPASQVDGTVPTASLLASLGTSAGLLALTSFGITDGALPTLVRAAMPPAVALVLAVLALAHHWTIRGAQQALAAAGQTAQATATAPGIPSGVRVSAENFDQIVTAIGAYVATQRQGVLAAGPAADAGRHAIPVPAPAPDDTPTVVLPAVSDPLLAGLPTAAETTLVMPVIPSVPSGVHP